MDQPYEMVAVTAPAPAFTVRLDQAEATVTREWDGLQRYLATAAAATILIETLTYAIRQDEAHHTGDDMSAAKLLVADLAELAFTTETMLHTRFHCSARTVVTIKEGERVYGPLDSDQ